MPDDALPLHGGADHEAGHVGEEQQRHVERVAELDEPGGLVGGVDEQHAALEQRVVRDHADDLAGQPGEPDRQLPAPTARGSRRTSPRPPARAHSAACRRPAARSAGTQRGQVDVLRSAAGLPAALAASSTGGRTGSGGPPRARRPLSPRGGGRTRTRCSASGAPPISSSVVFSGDHLDHPRAAQVHGRVAIHHRHVRRRRRGCRRHRPPTARTARTPAGSCPDARTWVWRIFPAPRRPGNISTWSVIRARPSRPGRSSGRRSRRPSR